MLADRQTDRQTNWSQYSAALYRGQVIIIISWELYRVSVCRWCVAASRDRSSPICLTDHCVKTGKLWYYAIYPFDSVLYNPRTTKIKTRQSVLISQRPSRTPHLWGCAPRRGAMTSKFELVRNFCTKHLPTYFIILWLLVRKLSCWQTHKRTNKHIPLKTLKIFR